MAIDINSIRRGIHIKPPRMTVYGTHGVGKTSFGAGAPKPVLVQLEEGEGLIDIPRFPLIKTYAELMEVIGVLVGDDHDFQTAVIDTADWMEPIIHAETCRANSWSDIESPGFGKGYAAADSTWREVLAGFDAMQARGIHVIVLAHSEVKTFNDPTSDNYDRHQIKLQKRAWGLLQEWSDVVAFLNFRTVVEKSDAGFNKKIAKGKGFGERVLYLEERPAYYAKNRYRLPPELTLPPDDPEGMYRVFGDALSASISRASTKQPVAAATTKE